MNKQREVPVVSAVLVMINILVFIICSMTGKWLYNLGMLDLGGVFAQKEYGRILFSMFLHSDISHLFNNMLILFFLGAMLEKELGHFRYLLLFLLSGIGGNLLSLLYKVLTYNMTGTIGASGAIFGMDGALLALILFSRTTMSEISPGRVILMIAYSLYSGFAGSNIDNAAHIGGLCIGFIIGSIMTVTDKRKKVKDKRDSFEY